MQYMHAQGFEQSVRLFWHIIAPPPPAAEYQCLHAFRTTWIEIIVSHVEEVTYSNVPLTARQPMESTYTQILDPQN